MDVILLHGVQEFRPDFPQKQHWLQQGRDNTALTRPYAFSKGSGTFEVMRLTVAVNGVLVLPNTETLVRQTRRPENTGFGVLNLPMHTGDETADFGCVCMTGVDSHELPSCGTRQHHARKHSSIDLPASRIIQLPLRGCPSYLYQHVDPFRVT